LRGRDTRYDHEIERISWRENRGSIAEITTGRDPMSLLLDVQRPPLFASYIHSIRDQFPLLKSIQGSKTPRQNRRDHL